jgi:energy-coupling factor transporter transmembrane protein EcfT
MANSKPTSSQPSPPEEALPYTSGMRIFGGTAWGTLIMMLVASILVVIPQFPRPWLWVIPPGWLFLVLVGVALQWSVARGNCPKCGTALVVPPGGRRCPQCKTALKAQNREIVRLY